MVKRFDALLHPHPHHAPWHALCAGGVAVLGLPSGPSPLAMVAGLALFLRLLPDLSVRRGAWLGFLFGVAYFGVGFSWLLTSLHVYGGISLAVSLAMLLGLSAVMSLYPALFGGLLPLLLPRRVPPHAGPLPATSPSSGRMMGRYGLLPLAAPALWTVTEWLRAHVLGGFAWNLVGYAWNPWLPMLQLADLGGVFLLSWLMVFSASVLAMVWLRRSGWREMVIVGGMLGMVLGAVSFHGLWRMETLSTPVAHTSDTQTGVASLRVGIVQGNIPQQLKWSSAYRNEAMDRYLTLSRRLPRALDLIIWPETAIAFFLQANPLYLDQISHLVQERGTPLLTGTPMVDPGEKGTHRYYNSMVLLDGTGSLTRRYDKHHLVPFGEFIPFRRFVPSTFKKFTEGSSDFSSGPGPVPLSWEKGDIGPLICYEAIFPDEVRQLALTGVAWLVNITNDGWFGDWAKPQHLAMVRLRAIENRLPIIRAANTGISAVFDAVGRRLGHIPGDEAGTLVVTLPRGRGDSFYRQSGPYWVWGWMGLCLLSVWLSRMRWCAVEGPTDRSNGGVRNLSQGREPTDDTEARR